MENELIDKYEKWEQDLSDKEKALDKREKEIQEKEERMMKLLYEGLGKIPGVQIYGSFAECKGPVMSPNFQGLMKRE